MGGYRVEYPVFLPEIKLGVKGYAKTCINVV